MRGRSSRRRESRRSEGSILRRGRARRWDGSGAPSLTSSTGSRGPGTRARRAPLPLRVARGGDRRVNGGSARNTRDGTGLVRAASSVFSVLRSPSWSAPGRGGSRAVSVARSAARVLVAGRARGASSGSSGARPRRGRPRSSRGRSPRRRDDGPAPDDRRSLSGGERGPTLPHPLFPSLTPMRSPTSR